MINTDLVNKEWTDGSRKIRTAAIALISTPEVQAGYIASGEGGYRGRVHIVTMSRKRLMKYIKIDIKNAILGRMEALGELMAADCINRHYTATFNHKGEEYDYKKMCTELDKKIKSIVENDLPAIRARYESQLKGECK